VGSLICGENTNPLGRFFSLFVFGIFGWWVLRRLLSHSGVFWGSCGLDWIGLDWTDLCGGDDDFRV